MITRSRPSLTTAHQLGTGLLATIVMMVVAALLATTLGPVGTAQARPPDERPRGAGTAVLEWNELASRAAAAACIAPLDDPLHESRMYAMTQVAVHDALNAIDRRARPYATSFTVDSWADPRAAIASAARDTLVATIAEIPEPFGQPCRDAATALVETFYAEQIAQLPAGRERRLGLWTGHRAADGVLTRRHADGAAEVPLVVTDFPQGDRPGQWRFTPGTGFAFAPGWGAVKPFGLSTAEQFRTPGPRPLASADYARDLAEVKRLGGDGLTASTRRTTEQTEIALFWLESSPTMWNRVARTLATSHHLDAWEQAQLLGQLEVALADGYIASFATKYADLAWRPVTAIRLAGDDGNPRTTADPTWTPLRTTPAIPDHDSAHAVQGGAATAVLSRFFGSDRQSFAVCSDTLPEAPCGSANPRLRRFSSLSDAAQENAVSRVYIGFHFRWATEVGTRHGGAIGRWTATHVLQSGC